MIKPDSRLEKSSRLFFGENILYLNELTLKIAYCTIYMDYQFLLQDLLELEMERDVQSKGGRQ